MSRGLGASAALLVPAFRLVEPLAPPAAADHPRAHRRVARGRVLDADRDPAFVGCLAGPRTVAEAFGEMQPTPVTDARREDQAIRQRANG